VAEHTTLKDGVRPTEPGAGVSVLVGDEVLEVRGYERVLVERVEAGLVPRRRDAREVGSWAVVDVPPNLTARMGDVEVEQPQLSVAGPCVGLVAREAGRMLGDGVPEPASLRAGRDVAYEVVCRVGDPEPSRSQERVIGWKHGVAL